MFTLYGYRGSSDALELKKFHSLGGAIVGMHSVLESCGDHFFTAMDIKTQNKHTGRILTLVTYEREGIE